MQKKHYISPELEIIMLDLREDVLSNSFEEYSSQIIDDEGWGDEGGG